MRTEGGRQTFLPGEGGDVSLSEAVHLVRKGTWPRAGFSVLMALAATSILPLDICLSWAAAIVAWECWVRRYCEDALARSARDPEIGFRWLAAINFFGAILFAAFAVATWSTGDPVGLVLATAWVASTANHLFVYFMSHRLLMIAALAPLVTCALATPFLVGGVTVLSALGAVALLCLVIAAGVFGFDRQILLRARAEQAAARIRAEEASRAKSSFLSTMSGELRGPLNEIVGYAELIEEEAAGATSQDAARIKLSAQNLLRLLNIVADVAKLESGVAELNRDLVPVQAILRSVRDAASPLAAATGVSLSIDEAASLGDADLDHLRLHHALLQIVSAALHNASGGAVEVRAARKIKDGGDVLEFEVIDTGPALDLEKAARLFQPFAGAASDVQGIGLGFSRDIVRLMGGDVAYNAQPGRRPSFFLSIPTGQQA
jgi:signal transduction histidine kinase